LAKAALIGEAEYERAHGHPVPKEEEEKRE
jgi:hypothetical protein